MYEGDTYKNKTQFMSHRRHSPQPKEQGSLRYQLENISLKKYVNFDI